MDELIVEEWEEQRKWNVDWKRAYRERNLKQLEESRNQFAQKQKNLNVERQRQNSTNILVEPTVEDVEHVRVRYQCVDDMVQFQIVQLIIWSQRHIDKNNIEKELTAQEREDQRKRNHMRRCQNYQVWK